MSTKPARANTFRRALLQLAAVSLVACTAGTAP